MRMLLLLGAFAWHATSSTAMAVPPTLEALDSVTRSVNAFSVKLFKAIAENESGKNLVCSPISASMVLSMAAFGAGGNTERQLRSVLELDDNDSLTKAGIRSLVDGFANFKEVELRLANKIFLAEGFQPKAEFTGVTESAFRSKARSVDFGRAAEASKTINEWCEARTNGRIKDLVEADDFGRDTALVLVNAVYFKGDWASKFDVAQTTPRPFHVDGTTVKDVPTMHRSGSYRYGELPNVNAKFVELPYKSNDSSDAVSMFIILPNEINGLAELEKNLEKVTVEQLLRGSVRDVNIYLPKFKIESTVNLQEPLTKLGLIDMFTDAANFTGIVDVPPLKVSKVIQKAFIEVNEEGSEAAAATGMAMQMRCMIYPKEMTIDRPFLYAIISKRKLDDSYTNVFYLFTGIVTNPEF